MALARDAGRRPARRSVPRVAWALPTAVRRLSGYSRSHSLLREGRFRSGRLYDLVCAAKDPLVLGVGLAATRDIVSFFRPRDRTIRGRADPVAGLSQHTVAIGDSQSGNFIKYRSSISGSIADLEDRMVWEGAFARIAARQTPMNFRFALPGGAAELYEPGSEPALWWTKYDDKTRGRTSASLLDRCTATKTCPKVIEAFGLDGVLGPANLARPVGTDAARDIPLPDNVRRYYYPGTTHGGGARRLWCRDDAEQRRFGC